VDRKQRDCPAVSEKIECPRAGIDLDDIVEPGAGWHTLYLRERDRLMRGAGIVHIDDGLVGAAGKTTDRRSALA